MRDLWMQALLMLPEINLLSQFEIVLESEFMHKVNILLFPSSSCVRGVCAYAGEVVQHFVHLVPAYGRNTACIVRSDGRGWSD